MFNQRDVIYFSAYTLKFNKINHGI